ncbi:MAG: hypothetical protein EXS00_00165 [Phycisphaerales bacterium]|nr:hypothetical protein [Phycisphaerales bacterium]
MMALFALGIAATAATAFVKSRDNSVVIGRSMEQAARARMVAAQGLAIAKEVLASIFQQSDATLATQWRAQLADGVLLSNFQVGDAVLNVSISDIATGVAPSAATTEFRAGITVTIGGTSYSMTAEMSLQSLVKGQYAIYADKYFSVEGDNFVGRWENSPQAGKQYPVSIGTQGRAPWWGNEGVYLGAGAHFESDPVIISGAHGSLAGAIATKAAEFKRASKAGHANVMVGGVLATYDFTLGANPLQSSSWTQNGLITGTDPSTFIYYPDDAESLNVWGDSADEVEQVQMTEGESILMIAPPTEPSFVPGTTYLGNKIYSGVTQTLNPIRVKCWELFGIPIGGGDLTIKNNSFVTMNSGVYRVDDKFKLENSRLIINGNVKIVMKARMWFDLDAKSFEMINSSVELKENSQLLFFVAYDLASTGSWVGKSWTCPNEPDATLAAGDPHRKKWLNQWVANSCSSFEPSEPQYLEPWRVRIYPDPAFLSSIFLWDFNNSSIIGSIFMPTNPVILRGSSELYGRIAAKHVILRDEASFYYDHALDDITGLTEGAPPPRGGTQSIPTRISVNF